ncbi:MAG: hypothetical protein M1824_004450 [Vezdaea acicularis]|nr:MAG: hypothetical protein M1824_004450 [Vezdaea acicularis]
MFGILQGQAPAKQTATDTINTLSARLSTATLLEDRRAAIQGLRSFARAYPASVASGALRNLIVCLSKDSEDVDTAKAILETLLMLFRPDENSPEASEDIAFWLADEFTQRQDNITVLLDLLDQPDFFSRLLSLQLLGSIRLAREERTQECILNAPLGISRLAAILDDRRDAIRNEGLLLLAGLTPSSSELQKLVAFENAFDRIFNIINTEGGLLQGGIIVQDCLSLLANLLRLNPSNQSFFRETGCVVKLTKLISDVVGRQDVENTAEWERTQSDKNLWGVLAVLRLFLVQGGLGTQANQNSFWQSGVLLQVLQLAFSKSTGVTIRAEALKTCADLIRGNRSLQERFAQLQVKSLLDGHDSLPNGDSQQNGVPKVYVVDGLLEVTLAEHSNVAFDARIAACDCIKAYIFNHNEIRQHFLDQAIKVYLSGVGEVTNVLTALLVPEDTFKAKDPYRQWLAAVILMHLIYDNSSAKTKAMGVTEGDAESGEEVVTFIQSLTGILVAGIEARDDERIPVGYLMLLCIWMFEDPDAVNDFLGEGNSIQSLVQAVIQGGTDLVIVQGLCAILLGIIYEFSTKDSPIPRATLHPILASRMGREQYIDRITRLREHPLLRDYEVLPQNLDPEQPTVLPEVYFDKLFVDFIKDNFSRLIRAIDRDPGMEIPVIANGIQKGISRELVDSLRTQLEDKSQSLESAKEELITLERKLGQEQADHRRSKETAAVELNRIKFINESLHKSHNDQIDELQKEHARSMDQAQKQYQSSIQAVEAQLDQVGREADEALKKVRERHAAETTDLNERIAALEANLEKANKDHIQDLKIADEEFTSQRLALESRMKRAEERSEEAETRANRAEQKLTEAEFTAAKACKLSDENEEARKGVQTELDDLLMVLQDLEEKRTNDKKRLKALGEEVSDVEEDEEEDETEAGADEVD